MISFSKMTGHYGEDDRESVHIHTEGKTLGEITQAFRLFLTSCGFQCEEEIVEPEKDDAIKKIREDFYI